MPYGDELRGGYGELRSELSESIEGRMSVARHDPEWVLRTLRPGEAPGDDASPKEVIDWVCRRNTFVAASPWITAQFMAVFQGLIDDWSDPDRLSAVLDDLGAYLDLLVEHAKALDPEAEGTIDISAALRLDDTLELARTIDPVKLLDDDERVREMLRHALLDLLAVLSTAWHRGTPLASGPVVRAAHTLSEGHIDEVTLKSAGHALLEAMRSSDAPDTEPFIVDWSERLAARVAGPGHEPLTLDDIPDRDVFYEFLAHRYAYEPGLEVFELALRANGYSPERSMSFDSSTGLGFHIVMPDPDEGVGKPAIFVFRGTRPDDLNDIRTDLEFQIGQSHFDALEQLGLFRMLRGAAKDCGGLRPHVTGHSLGGALAQLAAAYDGALIDQVVTFQAPGLTRRNRSMPDRAKGAHRPQVRHYIADDDVVHLAGQKHLPGETILVSALSFGTERHWDWGAGHSDLLLMGHGMRERLLGLGLAGVWTPHMVCAFARVPEHPSENGSFHESVRGGLSLSIRLARSVLAGERTPTLVVRRARFLLAEALDQPTPDLSKGVVEIGKILATSVWRGATGGLGRLRPGTAGETAGPMTTALGPEDDVRAALDRDVAVNVQARVDRMSAEEMFGAGLAEATEP